MKKIDVLVTDGNYKHTYVILKSLCSKGLNVGVLVNSVFNVSFLTFLPVKKIFVKSDIISDPSINNLEKYKNEVINILKHFSVDVLMPVGNNANYCFSTFREELLLYAKLTLPDVSSMEIAQNKVETFQFAKINNFLIPKTYFPDDKIDIDYIEKNIGYPCVLKKTNFSESGVYYCHNKDELHSKFSTYKSKKNSLSPPIIQDLIKGTGYGFFALFEHGKCKNFFMHERIHELPVTGGSSTMAKSIYNEDLFNQGVKILEELKWHGIAMVEFKKDIKDGKFKLIEINPKFWGSLELSILAGIDFPYLLYLLSKGMDSPSLKYKKDIVFRWTLPNDLIWSFQVSKAERKKFRDFKKKNKIHSNWNLKDPLVFLYYLFYLLYKLFTLKKRPHGILNK